MNWIGYLIIGLTILAAVFSLLGFCYDTKCDMKNSFRHYGDQPAIPDSERNNTLIVGLPCIGIFLFLTALTYNWIVEHPKDVRRMSKDATEFMIKKR